ncbi:hypothetical protein Tco_0551488, partial [Tanacetum coccineum]
EASNQRMIKINQEALRNIMLKIGILYMKTCDCGTGVGESSGYTHRYAFEPMTSVFDEPNETNEYDLSREVQPCIFDLHRTTSPYSSSRSELHDPIVD